MDHSQYFSRRTVFTREDEQVILLDLSDPNGAVPLDEWLGSIVSLADGQHTLAHYIAFISSQYPAGPPNNLAENIEAMLEHLIELQAISLSDQAIELPYYLSMAAKDQDMERAKRLMIQDGFIQV